MPARVQATRPKSYHRDANHGMGYTYLDIAVHLHGKALIFQRTEIKCPHKIHSIQGLQILISYLKNPAVSCLRLCGGPSVHQDRSAKQTSVKYISIKRMEIHPARPKCKVVSERRNICPELDPESRLEETLWSEGIWIIIKI